MRLRGYVGERPGFLGGANAICDCREYCCFPIETHTQPFSPPPNSDSDLLILLMHSLWVPIRDMEVILIWYRISGLYVNDSQILSTAGNNTATMMASFIL